MSILGGKSSAQGIACHRCRPPPCHDSPSLVIYWVTVMTCYLLLSYSSLSWPFLSFRVKLVSCLLFFYYAHVYICNKDVVGCNMKQPPMANATCQVLSQKTIPPFLPKKHVKHLQYLGCLCLHVVDQYNITPFTMNQLLLLGCPRVCVLCVINTRK